VKVPPFSGEFLPIPGGNNRAESWSSAVCQAVRISLADPSLCAPTMGLPFRSHSCALQADTKELHKRISMLQAFCQSFKRKKVIVGERSYLEEY